jgi:isochorismate synthase
MIDFFIKVKQQESQNLPFVLYKKPDKIKVVGYFQKNDHLYFAENFEEVGFIFAPLKAAKDTNSFDQSVKWSALLTSGRNS